MTAGPGMLELSIGQWVLLGVGAALIGFAKTSIGGAGSVAAALFAVVLPARQSTGAILPLLICGDVLAVTAYRRHAEWRLLWRLTPWVLFGVGLGVALVARLNDRTMRPVIGGMLLAVLVCQVIVRRSLRERLTHLPDAPPGRTQRLAAAVVGTVAGFTTMVANSAGPVMTVYLLLSGLTMMEFLGTGAWFFLLVNLFKTPFSGALGLISPHSLAMDAVLAPVVVGGALIGMALIRRIDQARFERAVLAMAGVSAAILLM